MDTGRFPNLFLDKESSDIQLHIYTTAECPEATVPAHSLVLRTAGKVLRTMVENANFKEGRNADVGLVVKGDVQDAIVFLRYLYTRELEEVELDVYISLLQTAHLHELEGLVRLCNERIAGKLSPLTVCRTYRSVKNLASEDLLARCKDLMLDCAFLIFSKNLHLTLDEKTMAFLFSSERLNFLDQEQALVALKRWGCARRAFDFRNGKNSEQQVADLVAQMEKSLAYNASHWSLRLWKNFELSSEMAFWSIEQVTSRLKSALWKYWTSGKEGDTDDHQLPALYMIKTEPRLKNEITKFAKAFYLVEKEYSPDEISITSRSFCLMNICLTGKILLAGFTIQLKYRVEALTARLEIRENLSFRLNDKELLVNNYEVSEVCGVSCNNQKLNPKAVCGSNLIIILRTPVLLEKATENVLTIVFEPKLFFTIALTGYSFPEEGMLHFENTGLFCKRDGVVAVRKLYYFT